MVLQGDLSGGVRFLENAIRYHDSTGCPNSGRLVRLMLAQVYIEMISAKTRPPFLVLLKHFPFLIGVKFTGWNAALKNLLTTQKVLLGDGGFYGASVEANLGILYKLAKRERRHKNILRRLGPELNALARRR